VGHRPLRRLRRGELQALLWSDVDFEGGVIRVERRLGPRRRVDRPQEPHGETAGAAVGDASPPPARAPPVPGPRRRRALRRFFARAGLRPADGLGARQDAWAKAGLSPISLHECRHAYAAFMIAAGVNAKALSIYMGHSSITITLDRYGHLMPGNKAEAAGMLAGYLDREAGA